MILTTYGVLPSAVGKDCLLVRVLQRRTRVQASFRLCQIIYMQDYMEQYGKITWNNIIRKSIHIYIYDQYDNHIHIY